MNGKRRPAVIDGQTTSLVTSLALRDLTVACARSAGLSAAELRALLVIFADSEAFAVPVTGASGTGVGRKEALARLRGRGLVRRRSVWRAWARRERLTPEGQALAARAAGCVQAGLSHALLPMGHDAVSYARAVSATSPAVGGE